MKTFLFTVLLILPQILFSQVDSVAKDSAKIVTPEGTGKYLYNLLIDRANITETPFTIDVNKLFPDKDLSEFNDSPAEFILSLLHDYQLKLPQSWSKLLFNADSLQIDKDAKYLRTYFLQFTTDQFFLTSVLEAREKYYALSFRIMDWEDKRFIASIDSELKSYETIEKLVYDKFISNSLFDYELGQTVLDLYTEQYNYKQFRPYDVHDITIPSLDPFINKLTYYIEQSEEFDKLDIFSTASDLFKVFPELLDKNILNESPELNNIDKDTITSKKDSFQSFETEHNKGCKDIWEALIASIHENKYTNLHNSDISMNNILQAGVDVYNAILTYEFKVQDKTYKFLCSAILVDNEWKLLNTSLAEEDVIFQF